MAIKLYNGLPLFSAEISEKDDGSGVYCISFVTDPATEMPFFAFDKKLMKYSIIDDKERIVTGVIMLANTPILRVDENGDGFYIVYTKDTLKLMAEKFLKEGYTSSVNIEHLPNSYVDSVNLQEIYIIDREKGIDPKMFKEAPDGSLIGTYKVRNDEVWDKIMKGEVYSFSLEGYFNMMPVEFKKDNNNQINTENKMSKNSKIAKFVKSLMKFGQVETDKGFLYFEPEEIAEGVEVYVGEEEKVPAEDGEYIWDEKIIVVVDGKVSEIKEKEEVVEEPEKPAEEPVKAEEEVIEEPVEEPVEVADPYEERIAALEAKIAELEGTIADLVERITKIESTPAVEPVIEEFEKVVDVNTKGLSKGAQKSINLFKSYNKKK